MSLSPSKPLKQSRHLREVAVCQRTRSNRLSFQMSHRAQHPGMYNHQLLLHPYRTEVPQRTRNLREWSRQSQHPPAFLKNCPFPPGHDPLRDKAVTRRSRISLLLRHSSCPEVHLLFLFRLRKLKGHPRVLRIHMLSINCTPLSA